MAAVALVPLAAVGLEDAVAQTMAMGTVKSAVVPLDELL